MKKTPVILVVCALLFSSLDVLAQQNNAGGPVDCCFKYYPKRLPKNNVVTFQRTDIHCVKNAVVFEMKNGAKFCADPAEKWVQDTITTVEARPRV